MTETCSNLDVIKIILISIHAGEINEDKTKLRPTAVVPGLLRGNDCWNKAYRILQKMNLKSNR